MVFANPDKVLIGIVGISACVYLCTIGKVTGGEALVIIAAVIGYVLGNGHGIIVGEQRAVKSKTKEVS